MESRSRCSTQIAEHDQTSLAVITDDAALERRTDTDKSKESTNRESSRPNQETEAVSSGPNEYEADDTQDASSGRPTRRRRVVGPGEE